MAANEVRSETRGGIRRRAGRYAVPVAVAGVAAATIGLVPALAASGDPDLPEITARQLIEKIAASDTRALSGTFRVSTDLGLPALGGLVPGLAGPGGGGDSTADPSAKLTELATGTHTLRVAADGPERQRLTLLDGSDEYSLIHNGDDVWAHDGKSNEVFHEKGAAGGPERHEEPPVTPKELADRILEAADGTTSVTVDGTARVAGRDAYQLVIRPEQRGSTVGSVRIAVDAANGTPLKFTLVSAEGGKPVVDAGFTKVDFSRPAASVFAFEAPKGAKVTEGAAGRADGHPGLPGKNAPEDFGKGFAEGFGKGLPGLGAGAAGKGPEVIGEGWTTILKLDTGAPAPKAGEAPKELQGLLDSFGDKVTGKFGSGTLFRTKLVNALLTDDGRVYAGAVTKDALVDAANAGR
ncbi:outer membrane lipoprotein carrier protein LolA [Streptomyces sp. NPDC001744]|uniref:LolA family protein n=1 Tax=Streptomyces sp. NPDC001744 TaxID=3364606 RepID=UPI0036951160